jgi:hypothetical protein
MFVLLAVYCKHQYVSLDDCKDVLNFVYTCYLEYLGTKGNVVDRNVPRYIIYFPCEFLFWKTWLEKNV